MKFDTTPKPYFLQAMRNQSWNATGALAELIDNSFGPGRGDATTCHITYDPRVRIISVFDNGRGMESIGRMFQLGNTIGRTPGDIGLYGSGGTMAILWLGAEVIVHSLRATLTGSEVSAARVIWSEWIEADRFPQIDTTWKPATMSNTPLELLEAGHGTLITIKLARERGSLSTSNLKRDLAKIFGPGLRAGKHLIWTTTGRSGETVELSDPIVMPDDPDKSVGFDFTIQYDEDLLPVTGVVGLVEGLRIQDAGVAIGYGHRMITKTKDCFSSSDGEKRYTGSSVTGWLDLGEGWQPYLSTTKAGVNDQPLWTTLMDHVFHRIEPLLQESDDEKLLLELADIALNLQIALDGKATVTVTRSKVDIPEMPEPTGEEGGEEPEPKVSDEGEGDKPLDRPAKSQIYIAKVSDHEIDGLLCLAELRQGKDIIVSVNKDHIVIQTALIQRPVNKMLLNQAIIGEIANELASDPDICRQVFRRRHADAILAEDAPATQRNRRIVRLLSTPRPMAAAS